MLPSPRPIVARSTPGCRQTLFLGVGVGVGSADETSDKSHGLAHLLEHLVFLGTHDDAYPDRRSIDTGRGRRGQIQRLHGASRDRFLRQAPRGSPRLPRRQGPRGRPAAVRDASAPAACRRRHRQRERGGRAGDPEEQRQWRAPRRRTILRAHVRGRIRPRAPDHRHRGAGARDRRAPATVRDFWATHYRPGNMRPLVGGSFTPAQEAAVLRMFAEGGIGGGAEAPERPRFRPRDAVPGLRIVTESVGQPLRQAHVVHTYGCPRRATTPPPSWTCR